MVNTPLADKVMLLTFIVVPGGVGPVVPKFILVNQLPEVSVIIPIPVPVSVKIGAYAIPPLVVPNVNALATAASDMNDGVPVLV